MATEITDKMATEAYAETHAFKTCYITLYHTRMRIMDNVQGKGFAAM